MNRLTRQRRDVLGLRDAAFAVAADAQFGLFLACCDVSGIGRRVPRRNNGQGESGDETPEAVHDKHSHSQQETRGCGCPSSVIRKITLEEQAAAP
jgi:hypothetical protein